MKVVNFLSGLIAGTMLLAASEASAVTWVVDAGGTLTGAKGVVVGGKSYDVTFGDGTCQGLFSGCNANSDFTFQTLNDALAAGNALLNDVFKDVAAGLFDTKPGLTNGCGPITNTLCRTYIPYQIAGPGTPPPWDTVVVKNNAAEGGDLVVYTGGINGEDTTGAILKTFAVFTPSGGSGDTGGNGGGPVPEPATWLTMIVGFGLAGASLRRRRRQTVKFTFA